MLATLVLIAALQLPQPVTPARMIVDSASAAAESAALREWLSRWSPRPSGDRQSLLARGAAAYLLYQPREASALLTQALGAPPRDDDVARLAGVTLARVEILRGAYREANSRLQQVQRSAARAGDSATVADALLLRASIIRRLETTAASDVLLDSAESAGAARRPRLAATLHCSRAGIAGTRGEVAVMRRHADAGLAAARTAGSKRLEAACHFSRATSFVRVGATDSARAAFADAVTLQRASGDLAALAAAQQWMGFYLVTLGRHDRAGVMLREAWTAARASGNVNAQAWTALSQATLASSINNDRDTRQWLQAADSLMRLTGDEEGQRSALRMRVAAAFAAGDTARGWRLLDDVQQRAERAGDRTGVQGALATRARQAIDQGDAPRARAAVAAWRVAQPGRGFEASYQMFEGEVALLEQKWDVAQRAFGEVLAATHPSQHHFRHGVHLLRALAQAQGGDLEGAVREARGAEDAHDRWRATIADSVLRQYTTRPARGARSYRTALIGLLAQGGRIEDAVRLAESQRARRLREQLADADAWVGGAGGGTRAVLPTPSLAGIQRALPDERTAIMEFVAARGSTPSLWLVVTRQRAWHVLVPSMDEVAPQLQRLRGLIEGGRPATDAARQLGRLLMDPVMPGLDADGITQVVVVADEALHLLPFHLLRLADGRTVLERLAVSTMPSMAVAADSWGRPRARGMTPALLAYGDPRLSREVTATMAVPAALPGARAEVRAVSARYPSSVVRVGREASERQFKRDLGASDAAVVHVAVHGVVEAWDGRQAALALAPDEGEDGLLYAGEVAGLTMRAPLVVLSACRTDAGEVVAGEGVTGLTTAFLQAGARTVITSAWPIPDRSVVPLVDAFHAALAAGQPVGAALRQAQLASLARGDPPRVWASFTIVGDATRPVVTR